MPVKDVDSRVEVILDLKTPGSGEVARNDWENLEKMKPTDQIKFVVGDRNDYEWARSKILEFGLESRVSEILISPVSGELQASELANWVLEDRLPVRFQLQLHKLVWGDKPGV
jgi:7-carboxy-7-deazaguanine synthase